MKFDINCVNEIRCGIKEAYRENTQSKFLSVQLSDLLQLAWCIDHLEEELGKKSTSSRNDKQIIYQLKEKVAAYSLRIKIKEDVTLSLDKTITQLRQEISCLKFRDNPKPLDAYKPINVKI